MISTLIKQLNLETHPEGGYYKEIYRSKLKFLPADDMTDDSHARNLATSIYYLLEGEDVSRFHKLKSDEIWYYHYGCPMIVHMFQPDKSYERAILGNDLANGEKFQVIIPAGTVFGAEPKDNKSFSLVGCMVAPGFDFRDFTLINQSKMNDEFPNHKELIQRLAY